MNYVKRQIVHDVHIGVDGSTGTNQIFCSVLFWYVLLLDNSYYFD